MGSVDPIISCEKVFNALTGPTPVMDVFMGGVCVPSMIDTGSMVTLITESFFKEHFECKGKDVLQECGWLTLKAANGLSIPYLGYLELDVKIMGKILPKCGVLVVKDPTDPVTKLKRKMSQD